MKAAVGAGVLLLVLGKRRVLRMNRQWFQGINPDMPAIEKREAVIAELTEKSHFFAVSAVTAVYFWMQSLKWGTVETTAYFMRSAGIFGSLACACSLIGKHLKDGNEIMVLLPK